MRKRFWITGTVIVAACLLLIWLKAPRHQTTTSPSTTKEVTNQPPSHDQAVPPQLLEPSQRATGQASSSNVVAEMAQRRAVEETNALQERQERALATWRAPIDFFGKVVDENTNPVAGAMITFSWSETPTYEGEQRATTQSDSEGLFSLRDKHGPNLVVWVSKDGYYASGRGQKGFDYMARDLSPDPQNPILFFLRKKGTSAEGLVSMKQNYRIPRDGTPVSIDLVNGANTTGENGNLVVRCWTNDQGKRSGEKYDWRCGVTIPSGGVIATDEEFPFLAPETGYKPTAEINMPADRPGWKSDVDLKFFYRLADGRYGRMKFSMIAGGQHFCMIDSVLNPTGSRNLEPSN